MHQLVHHTREQVYSLWFNGVILRDAIVAGSANQEHVKEWAKRMSLLMQDAISPESRALISPHVNYQLSHAPKAESVWAAARALEDLLRPAGDKACVFMDGSSSAQSLIAFLEASIKVNKRTYGLGTTLSTLETIRMAGLSDEDGRCALAAAVDRGVARYRLEDASERFTIGDVSEISDLIDELQRGGPMIVDTVSIRFESELSPDYREVTRGLAHRHGLVVTDVRLTDEEVDVDIEFAGDDATICQKAVQDFRLRLPAALSVSRVQVARGGDLYVAGQVAAQGPGAVASDNILVQNSFSEVDARQLLADLQGLLATLKKRNAETEENEETTAALTLAKGAVKQGDLPRAWGYVGSFAKSLLTEAQKAGFSVLTAWLKEKLGIQG